MARSVNMEEEIGREPDDAGRNGDSALKSLV